MKLATGQIIGFLNAPDPKIRVILFYGPDAGLVRERADALAKKTVPDLQDPFRVALLNGATISDDTARLYDEAAAQALGGGRRLVRVQHAVEGNTAAIDSILKDPPSNDSLILIEAGDLDKRSKLRSLCEGATPFATAIPCYVEDSAQRQRVIADILKTENLTAPRDVIAYLADHLPPDRIAMRSELEKLAMYKGGSHQKLEASKKKDSSPSLSLDDVHAVLLDSGGAELDDMINAVASGDARHAENLLGHLFAEQTSPVAILRAAQRHFLRLHLARGYCDKGLSAGEAVKKLQPPVFWKSVEPMTRQVQRWSLARLEKMLDHLFEAEAAVKRTGTPDTTLCAQLLIGAAGVGRSQS